MEEYIQIKENILQLLKSRNQDSIKLGIELFKSQLRLGPLGTIAFVLDNGLCPRRKLDRIHAITFEILGFQYYNSRLRYSRKKYGRDSLETLWKHPVTESTLEFELKSFRGNRLYSFDRGQDVLEYCLLDGDRIEYLAKFKL